MGKAIHFHPLFSTDTCVEQLYPFPDSLPKGHFGEHVHHVHVEYPVEDLLLVQAHQAGVYASVLHVGNGITVQHEVAQDFLARYSTGLVLVDHLSQRKLVLVCSIET